MFMLTDPLLSLQEITNSLRLLDKSESVPSTKNPGLALSYHLVTNFAALSSGSTFYKVFKTKPTVLRNHRRFPTSDDGKMKLREMRFSNFILMFEQLSMLILIVWYTITK
ncbi:hypothetical protein C5167_050209 [Papaver somniferum]|uniref:Uncharacterized protein n=1 Tax=Papaver somniferum TaxID=3469 RepID=A0A4Y7KS72_PAPSO|nr:hypothetical protein C5167_050209 [Papaver somniferum]